MAKFCSKCGNPLQENDKFCRKCGAPVRTIAPEPQVQRPAPSYDIPSNDFDNPEGTVLLGGMNKVRFDSPAVRKADLHLSLNEMLEGCSKVVDFGTGKKYELSIPAGLSPGDTITVESESLIDGDTGRPCTIELSVRMN